MKNTEQNIEHLIDQYITKDTFEAISGKISDYIGELERDSYSPLEHIPNPTPEELEERELRLDNQYREIEKNAINRYIDNLTESEYNKQVIELIKADKISEINRSNISNESYYNTLLNYSLENMRLGNKKILKTLFTQTELANSSMMKEIVLEGVLSLVKKDDYDEELVALLKENNPGFYQVLKKSMHNQNLEDELFISILENDPDINAKIDYFKDGKEVKLITSMLYSGRLDLAKWLIENHDIEKYSPSEMINLLHRSDIPDELLIKILDIDTINEPLAFDWLDSDGSVVKVQKLLISFLIHNEYRKEFVEYLAQNGAKISAEEAHNLLWNQDITDELLIKMLDIDTINEPFDVQYIHQDGSTKKVQDSLIASALKFSYNRKEFVEYLAQNGAKISAEEAHNLLWNQDITDEVLIKMLDVDTINEPFDVQYIHQDGSTEKIQELLIVSTSKCTHNRKEFVEYLAQNGAKISAGEVRNLLWNQDVSNELLIKMLDVDTINEPFTVDWWDSDGSCVKVQKLLISFLIHNEHRKEFVEYLAQNGADANFIDSELGMKLWQQCSHAPETFKILVVNGLDKDDLMMSHYMNIGGNQLSCSDYYDFCKWQKDFGDEILSAKEILSIVNPVNFSELFPIIQKIINPSRNIEYINARDENATAIIKDMQEEFANKIIHEVFPDKHLLSQNFIQFWHLNMSICNNFEISHPLAIEDICNLIGEELFNLYLDDLSS